MTPDLSTPAEWTPADPPDSGVAGMDAPALLAERRRVLSLACALSAEQAECAAHNAPPTRRIAAQARERCCAYRIRAVDDALGDLARAARSARAEADRARQRVAVSAREARAAAALCRTADYYRRFHDLARHALAPDDYAALRDEARRRCGQAVPE